MSEKLHNQLRLLETALSRLEKALAQPVDEFVRDSAIQRFEFTFELLWKSVKTYAEEAGVEVFSPRDSLRTGFQLGIIQERQDWFRMLEDRNLTSHTYNEATAESIYSPFAAIHHWSVQSWMNSRNEARCPSTPPSPSPRRPHHRDYHRTRRLHAGRAGVEVS